MNYEYQFHLLNDTELESLIVRICHKILGTATNRFNSRKDGGRDASFDGVANEYPSNSAPWRGKFIIQAKHTTSPTALCSDSDFRTQINIEIEKIKKLKDANQIDNYILFTNRSLTGLEEPNLKNRIVSETNVQNVGVHGKEWLNILLLRCDDIVREFNLDKYIVPLRFDEKELKDVITVFFEHIVEIKPRQETEIKRVNVEEKNRKNNLSQRYFEHMKANSLPYFNEIDDFLRSPINRELADKYLNITSELNNKILIHRNSFNEFEKIFEYIYDLLSSKFKEELKDNSRLIWVLLHYMYYNCDIGQE